MPDSSVIGMTWRISHLNIAGFSWVAAGSRWRVGVVTVVVMSILPAVVSRISTRCGGWVASHWNTIHWLGLSLQRDPWRLLPLDAPFAVAAARSLLSGMLEAGTRQILATEGGNAQKVDNGHNKGSNSHADEWNSPVTGSVSPSLNSLALRLAKQESSGHCTPVYPTVIIVVASTVVCRCAHGGVSCRVSSEAETVQQWCNR